MKGIEWRRASVLLVAIGALHVARLAAGPAGAGGAGGGGPPGPPGPRAPVLVGGRGALRVAGRGAVRGGAAGAGVAPPATPPALRHASDAAHTAAIDGTTRRLSGEGPPPPLSVGFFFAAGHSTVVFLA